MVNLKVCHSDSIDAESAANDIIKQAEHLDIEKIKAAVVHFSIEFDIDLIMNRLNRAFPNVLFSGCSSYGEMSSHLGWQDDSLLVGFFHGDDFSVGQIYSESTSNEFVFDKNNNEEEPKLVLCYSDAFNLSGEHLVKKIRKFIPRIAPIMGGLAADRWTFKLTKQIYNNQIFTTGTSCLVFYGDFDIRTDFVSGWEPVSKKGIITKATNNVVEHINYKPALDFYADALGTKDGTFGEYPLAIFNNDVVSYLRAPLMWDQVTGYVTFAGVVLENSVVAISSTTRANALEASVNLADKIMSREFKTEFGIISSCSARRQMLGTRAGDEIVILNEKLKVPLMGFYCYGEFFDHKELDNNNPGFLNETLCMVTFGKQ
jgi:hypothetical protein